MRAKVEHILVKAQGRNMQINRIYLLYCLAVVFLAVLMLAPLLTSGFVSDDSDFSFIKGTLSYNNQNLGDFTYGWIIGWLFHIGRFVPLSTVLLHTIFYIMGQNVFIYKLTILTFIIINILTFGYFIKLITGSRSLCLLSMLMAPLFFQIRLFHDPIVSFNLLMQLVFLFVILSMISLIYYLKKGKKKYLISSLFLYLLSLLTYELTYPLFILYFLLIYINSGKREFKYPLMLSAPFICLSLLCISIPFISRMYFGIPLVGGPIDAIITNPGEAFKSTYVPNPNPKEYIITLAKQTTAAFPLSYAMAHYARRGLISLKFLSSWVTIVIAILYFIFYLIISNAVVDELLVQKKREFNAKLFFVFGLFLLIMPGILVALSPKYQYYLFWGTGYLPVYVSYFGLMIMTICAIYGIYCKIYVDKRNIFPLSLILALIFSLTGSITYACNVSTLDELNNGWLYPRMIIENGLKDGLFKFVPDEAILLVDPSYPWDQPGFYLMNSGVKLGYLGSILFGEGYLSDKLPKAALRENFNNSFRYEFSNSDNIFYLKYFSQSKHEGYAVLGKVQELLATNKTLDRVLVSYMYIYIYHGSGQKEHLFIKDFYANDPRLQGTKINMDEINSSLVSSGTDWELYSINCNDLLIDAKSLFIV